MKSNFLSVERRAGMGRLPDMMAARHLGEVPDGMPSGTRWRFFDLGGPPGSSIRWLLCMAFVVLSSPCYAKTNYVWTNSPVSGPGNDWTNAWHDIQSAVNAAESNDTVLVTNGVYDTGSVDIGGSAGASRVVIRKPMIVRSVNGPDATVIKGEPGVRGILLDANVSVEGFTIANGYADGGEHVSELGGGIYCRSDLVPVVSNCIVSDCYAYMGGGVCYGILRDCRLIGNSASSRGGGAYYSTLVSCTLTNNFANYGGGACYSSMYNCTIIGNQSGGSGDGRGGGAWRSSMIGCLLLGNVSTTDDGGGAADSDLSNCTIVGNVARGTGGGVSACTLRNSIVSYNYCYNWSSTLSNHLDCVASSLDHCCTPSASDDSGNIAVAPMFVSSNDVHLATNSPCINAGANSYATNSTDLDGNERIQASIVDMGAYESPYALIHSSSLWHGSIHPAGRIGVLTSGSQAFSMTSAAGYPPVRDVLVDGVSVGPTGSYTVANLVSNHTIQAIFWEYPDTNGYVITGIHGDDSGAPVLSWVGTNGWTYSLQRSFSLLQPDWADVPPYTNIYASCPIAITNTMGSESQIFYRVKAIENN